MDSYWSSRWSAAHSMCSGFTCSQDGEIVQRNQSNMDPDLQPNSVTVYQHGRCCCSAWTRFSLTSSCPPLDLAVKAMTWWWRFLSVLLMCPRPLRTFSHRRETPCVQPDWPAEVWSATVWQVWRTEGTVCILSCERRLFIIFHNQESMKSKFYCLSLVLHPPLFSSPVHRDDFISISRPEMSWI